MKLEYFSSIVSGKTTEQPFKDVILSQHMKQIDPVEHIQGHQDTAGAGSGALLKGDMTLQ